jgi:hypothetical protein
MQVSVGTSRTFQDKIGRWLSHGRWTKILCHDKFYKRQWLADSKTITPNGPAIKKSKRCWASGGRRVGSLFWAGPVWGRKERSTAQFLQVRVQVFWVIRVSRYKFNSVLFTSHGTVIFLTTLERSGYRFITFLSRRLGLQKLWRVYFFYCPC